MILIGIILELVSFFFWDFPFRNKLLAAVARKIYLRQGTGVGALKKRFGGSYRFLSQWNFFQGLTKCFSFRRGVLPNIHHDASGNVIRSVILSLDELKITEKFGKGGRKVSSVGQRALDQVARQVASGEA
jgi:small subunit ribosomal protein S19e